jgi:hypothetical protein
MRLQLRIGPASIAIHADSLPDDVARENYVPFLSSDDGPATLTIRVHTTLCAKRGRAQFQEPIARLPTQWELFPDGNGYRLEILEQVEFSPRQVVLLNQALDEADVYQLPHRGMPALEGGWCLALVMNPFIQWWLTAHLALRRQGLIVHGSGVAIDRVGLAFVGPSEAGKTTIARWCRDRAAALLLNDERIVIWRQNGRAVCVSGTPWHGELPHVAAATAPLAGVFFLDKGDANLFTRWTAARSVSHLVPECFLPLWSAEAMSGLLQTADDFISQVPSGELQFVNGPAVADYLQHYARN